MNEKHVDIMNSQNNVEENQNKETFSIHERHEVQGTPFYVVGNDEKGYMITFGKWAISDKYKTIPEAEKYIDQNMWTIIVQIMAIIIDIEKGQI